MKNSELIELSNEIINQGGLISWANFGCRLGFFTEITDCNEIALEIIQYHVKNQEFELAGKFKTEYNIIIKNENS